MKYDLLICSLPRSGSHALMSALHGHPDVTMEGEIDMIDKFPLPPSKGTLTGAIWPAYRLKSHPLPLDTPVIFIVRRIAEIRASLARDPHGQNYVQYTEPTMEAPVQYPLPRIVTARLSDEWFALRRAMREHRAVGNYMVVTYQELFGKGDCREILCGDEICNWLRIKRWPLVPLTYKPTKNPQS